MLIFYLAKISLQRLSLLGKIVTNLAGSGSLHIFGFRAFRVCNYRDSSSFGQSLKMQNQASGSNSIVRQKHNFRICGEPTLGFENMMGFGSGSAGLDPAL